MNKLFKSLLLLAVLAFVFSLTSCPAPAGGSGLTERAVTPKVSIQLNSYCPRTQVTVYFSSGFGAVKTLEIYQALETGAFVKVATLSQLSGATVIYNIMGLQGKFRFYVKALRSIDNVWYTSVTWNYMTLCSGGSGSGSGGPSSSSGSGSGGPAPSSSSSSSSGG